MSFTMDFVDALVRSPNKKKAVDEEEEYDNHNSSPTRIMDFPEDSDTDTGALHDLTIAPLDESDIMPIIVKRQRNIQILPTLDEKENFEGVVNTIFGREKKRKKKNPALPKPSRIERIKEIIERSQASASIGDEDEAIKTLKKAFRMADNEVTRLKGQLTKSLEMHPATLKSIQTRLQEDLRDAALLAGQIKVSLTHLYERQGDYERAIVSCREAKSVYKKQRKRSPAQVPPQPAGLGTSGSSDSQDSERSIVWYVSCPEIDKHVKETTRLFDRLGRAQVSFEDRKMEMDEVLSLRQEAVTSPDPALKSEFLTKASSMAQECLRNERMALGKMHPQIADVLQLLSALSLDLGDRSKGIQYLLESLDICNLSLGPNHPRTGRDLLRMARLYQQPPVPGMAPGNRQDEDRAISYFEQAADVFRKVKGGHKVVGSIYNDLAVIQVARGEFTAALDLLQESLSSFETIETDEGSDSSVSSSSSSENSFTGICIDVVQVWRNMGECHVNTKNFEAAINCFVTALGIQRDARQRHDSVDDSELESVDEERNFLSHLMFMISDDSIADTLRRLGKAFTAAQRYEDAMVALKDAERIHRVGVADAIAFAKSGVATNLPAKQDNLANTLYCIAEVRDHVEDYEAAKSIFNESLKLRIASDSYRPENRRCNMVHCAMCVVGIGTVFLKQSQFAEAIKMYTDALHMCEAQGLPAGHAIVAMIEARRQVAEKRMGSDPKTGERLKALEKRAEQECKRGQLDKALATLTELLTIRQASAQGLLKLGKDASGEFAASARLYLTFAEIFAAQGDEANAQRARKDALRMKKQTVAKAGA